VNHPLADADGVAFLEMSVVTTETSLHHFEVLADVERARGVFVE